VIKIQDTLPVYNRRIGEVEEVGPEVLGLMRSYRDRSVSALLYPHVNAMLIRSQVEAARVWFEEVGE